MSSKSEYSPLHFEILSVDEVGHIAVSVELLRISYLGEKLKPSKVSVSFPLDAEQLSSVAISFRALFD